VIRAVISVVLAAALLAVALPAVDDAAATRTAATVEADAERLRDVATALAATDDAVPAGRPGAHRVVAVRLPPDSLATVPVDHLAVGGRPGAESGSPDPSTAAAEPPDDTPDLLAYRLAGRPTRTVRVPVDLRTPDGPVVLRGAGTHRLTLRLVRDERGVGVDVRRTGRPESTPT
jgi:hypothetical protein